MDPPRLRMESQFAGREAPREMISVEDWVTIRNMHARGVGIRAIARGAWGLKEHSKNCSVLDRLAQVLEAAQGKPPA